MPLLSVSCARHDAQPRELVTSRERTAWGIRASGGSRMGTVGLLGAGGLFLDAGCRTTEFG
jgi:hypothetical protein